MDQNKKKVKLNEELLDKISGGGDDPYYCDWGPGNNHEWTDYEFEPGILTVYCQWCWYILYQGPK